MTDKLTLYNGALGHLQEARLGSLTEAREPRRVLDAEYDGVVAYCLERKLWNFAYRTVSIDASDTVTPAFGYAYAFTIPDDWIRTRAISSSESLQPPLLDFKEEAGYWFANVTPLYVQYNSSDVLYGMNLGAWPQSFADYVELRLAMKTCKRITGKSTLLEGPQGIIKQEDKAMKVAAANCAMNDAVGFAPAGSWVRSRIGGFGAGGDNPGSRLIG